MVGTSVGFQSHRALCLGQTTLSLLQMQQVSKHKAMSKKNGRVTEKVLSQFQNRCHVGNLHLNQKMTRNSLMTTLSLQQPNVSNHILMPLNLWEYSSSHDQDSIPQGQIKGWISHALSHTDGYKETYNCLALAMRGVSTMGHCFFCHILTINLIIMEKDWGWNVFCWG